MNFVTTAGTQNIRRAMRVKARFLGLDFDPMTLTSAISCLSRTASADIPFTYVVTPNVDHMVRLDKEPSLRPLYDEARIVFNDSRVLEMMAKAIGTELPASPGADIVAALFEDTIKRDEAVVIIGMDAGGIDKLKARYGLTNIRWHDAPMGLKKDPAAVAEAARFMAENPARYHFICVGSPQQELIAWAARQRGDVKGLGLCCGASLDFLSGKASRAPEFLRKAKLEWLHRMATNPKRLAGRYLIGGPALLGMWWRYRKDHTRAMSV